MNEWSRSAGAPALLCLALLLPACAATRRAAPLPLEHIVGAERALVDVSRATRAQGPFPGAAQRRLPTRLWYAREPVDSPACWHGHCALILLAHGYGGNVKRLSDFARALAAAGYIVAAPAFPLTSDEAPGGYLPGFDDVVNQPADLSFVLDALLTANQTRGDPLHDRIDERRLGAVGHSMGGTTAIGVTRLECCADRRLGAAVLVAPAIDRVGPVFAEQWRRAGPPTLIIAGTADVVVALDAARDFYDAIETPRALVELAGADHVRLMENGSERPFLLQSERLAVAFFDAYLGGSAAELEAALSAARAAGHRARWEE